MAAFITFLIIIVIILLFAAGNLGVIGLFADTDNDGEVAKGCGVVIVILIILALLLYGLRECVS